MMESSSWLWNDRLMVVGDGGEWMYGGSRLGTFIIEFPGLSLLCAY